MTTNEGTECLFSIPSKDALAMRFTLLSLNKLNLFRLKFISIPGIWVRVWHIYYDWFWILSQIMQLTIKFEPQRHQEHEESQS